MVKLYCIMTSICLLGCSAGIDTFSGPYPSVLKSHRNDTESLSKIEHTGKNRVFDSDFGKVFREECRRMGIESRCYFLFDSGLHRDPCFDELQAIVLDLKNNLYVMRISLFKGDIDNTVQSRVYGPIKTPHLLDRFVELSKEEDSILELAQQPEPESTAGWGYHFYGYIDGKFSFAESMWVDSRIARFCLRGGFRYCPESLFASKTEGSPTWKEAAHYRESLMWYHQMKILIDSVIVKARLARDGKDVDKVFYKIDELD